MAVLQATHFLGQRPPLRLVGGDQAARNRELAEWTLDFTSLPYTTITHTLNVTHITVADLDDLDAWFVHLPALGIDRIAVKVERQMLWGGMVQAWALHVTAPSRRDGEARLLVYATAPWSELPPAALEQAVAA